MFVAVDCLSLNLPKWFLESLCESSGRSGQPGQLRNCYSEICAHWTDGTCPWAFVVFRMYSKFSRSDWAKWLRWLVCFLAWIEFLMLQVERRRDDEPKDSHSISRSCHSCCCKCRGSLLGGEFTPTSCILPRRARLVWLSTINSSGPDFCGLFQMRMMQFFFMFLQKLKYF